VTEQRDIDDVILEAFGMSPQDRLDLALAEITRLREQLAAEQQAATMLSLMVQERDAVLRIAWEGLRRTEAIGMMGLPGTTLRDLGMFARDTLARMEQEARNDL
jgi:DNA-directed RNA polymerase specialized sigma24 family protein